MGGYVVLVEFRLKSGSRGDFRLLVDENARMSIRVETGCRRFDVIEPADGPDTVLLYEIYDNRAAFDAHVASRHYAKFDTESAGYVVGKSVTVGQLVCEGSA
ncbi:putative quinol monooxygenase [Inquilinus limosus]|uniref:putative quinol monooxygenase n=1 Tax=Inquilinus limosus TaxID=171674 RepID=UPI000685B92A|nr:putative quinol monooxygenase [Inquilinus limosus]